MIAVIFEVTPKSGCKNEYLDIAADLRPMLDKIDGFVSIERFQSLSEEDKVLSLSFWSDEEAIAEWRKLEAHRIAQQKGRREIFKTYRLRIAEVSRDYGLNEREQAPEDSKECH